MHCNGNWLDNIENHWKLPGVWGTFYTGTTQSRECGRHLWCFLVPILLDTAAYYCRLFDSSRMFSLCWFLAALATLYLPNSDHPDPDHRDQPDHHDHPDPDQKECSKLYVIARAVLHCFNIFLLIISPQEIIIASILPLVILCEDTFTILKDHHSLVWLFWVANRSEWCMKPTSSTASIYFVLGGTQINMCWCGIDQDPCYRAKQIYLGGEWQ